MLTQCQPQGTCDLIVKLHYYKKRKDSFTHTDILPFQGHHYYFFVDLVPSTIRKHGSLKPSIEMLQSISTTLYYYYCGLWSVVLGQSALSWSQP